MPAFGEGGDLHVAQLRIVRLEVHFQEGLGKFGQAFQRVEEGADLGSGQMALNQGLAQLVSSSAAGVLQPVRQAEPDETLVRQGGHEGKFGELGHGRTHCLSGGIRNGCRGAS